MPKIIPAPDLAAAVEVIRAGGVVAFPTETYYGLAVDPFNAAALARLFRLKKRLVSKPILTVIDDQRQLPLLIREMPPAYRPLMAQFWPGPLTLIFKGRADLPVLLTGDTGTVGVRIPAHPVARALVRAVGGPVTATSANISGAAAAATAQEVRRQFGSGVELVLDGGKTAGETGSTIIGIENGRPRLLRAGVIPFARIEEALDHGR